MTTLGFDVYGTLIDTAGIATALERHAGERATAFSARWREKQLEYAFRRGLMQNYVDFSVCTRQALDYCCLQFGLDLSGDERAALMATYRELPPYPDALAGLEALSATPARLFAFSMGRPGDVTALLERAGLDRFFEDVVSVEEMQSFKPNPGAYAHFIRRTGAHREQAWLVSGNPFDVIGAISAGMNGAWVKRSPDAVFDPWEIEATVTVNTIGELVGAMGLQDR